eukprot:g36404.t1
MWTRSRPPVEHLLRPGCHRYRSAGRKGPPNPAAQPPAATAAAPRPRQQIDGAGYPSWRTAEECEAQQNDTRYHTGYHTGYRLAVKVASEGAL